MLSAHFFKKGIRMVFFWGIVFIIAGGVGSHWVRSRQFYRRNDAGVEEFSSYGSAVVAKLVERITMAVSFLAILAGVAMIVIPLMR